MHAKETKSRAYMQWSAEPAEVSLAKIKGAFAMNNLQARRVTCYMEDTEASRSFGE